MIMQDNLRKWKRKWNYPETDDMLTSKICRHFDDEGCWSIIQDYESGKINGEELMQGLAILGETTTDNIVELFRKVKNDSEKVTTNVDEIRKGK